MKKGKRDPIDIAIQAVDKLNKANITNLNRTRLKDILESYFQGTEEQKQEVMRMWRIDPAPKLIPDNESNYARMLRERREQRERDAKVKSEGQEIGKEIGKLNALQNAVKRLTNKRFGQVVTETIVSEIEAITDTDKLELILENVYIVASLEELRKLWA